MSINGVSLMSFTAGFNRPKTPKLKRTNTCPVPRHHQCVIMDTEMKIHNNERYKGYIVTVPTKMHHGWIYNNTLGLILFDYDTAKLTISTEFFRKKSGNNNSKSAKMNANKVATAKMNTTAKLSLNTSLNTTMDINLNSMSKSISLQPESFWTVSPLVFEQYSMNIDENNQETDVKTAETPDNNDNNNDINNDNNNESNDAKTPNSTNFMKVEEYYFVYQPVTFEFDEINSDDILLRQWSDNDTDTDNDFDSKTESKVNYDNINTKIFNHTKNLKINNRELSDLILHGTQNKNNQLIKPRALSVSNNSQRSSVSKSFPTSNSESFSVNENILFDHNSVPKVSNVKIAKHVQTAKYIDGNRTNNLQLFTFTNDGKHFEFDMELYNHLQKNSTKLMSKNSIELGIQQDFDDNEPRKFKKKKKKSYIMKSKSDHAIYKPKKLKKRTVYPSFCPNNSQYYVQYSSLLHCDIVLNKKRRKTKKLTEELFDNNTQIVYAKETSIDEYVKIYLSE